MHELEIAMPIYDGKDFIVRFDGAHHGCNDDLLLTQDVPAARTPDRSDKQSEPRRIVRELPTWQRRKIEGL